MSDWTVVDLETTFRAEDGAAFTAAESAPVVVAPSPREDLQRVLHDWSVRHDLPYEDRIIGTDDDGDLSIVLVGLTEDAEGDIVVNTRSYTVTASFTVEVTYTVEASSEDAARDAADEEFVGYSFDVSWGDGVVTDTEFVVITDVSED